MSSHHPPPSGFAPHSSHPPQQQNASFAQQQAFLAQVRLYRLHVMGRCQLECEARDEGKERSRADSFSHHLVSPSFFALPNTLSLVVHCCERRTATRVRLHSSPSASTELPGPPAAATAAGMASGRHVQPLLSSSRSTLRLLLKLQLTSVSTSIRLPQWSQPLRSVRKLPARRPSPSTSPSLSL